MSILPCSLQRNPIYHYGHLASGATLVASNEYVKELKGIDRKFLAVEMEAAGFVRAIVDSGQNIPWLVVRGISDYADSRKAALDSTPNADGRVGSGAWRRSALSTRGCYVLHLRGPHLELEALSSRLRTLQQILPWLSGLGVTLIEREDDSSFIQSSPEYVFCTRQYINGFRHLAWDTKLYLPRWTSMTSAASVI